MRAAARKPTFIEFYTPKLVTILREGYKFSDFKADCLAGLTVAIVALPLSMAIAIASGVTPDRGLYTAIVGGFLVSALGGAASRSAGQQAPSSCSSLQPFSSTASTGCFSQRFCPA
jgi:SulP family sulfate permease